MLKKFIAGSALAAAVLAMAAPAASAASWGVSRGTHPNQAAATAKCNQGKFNGWWDGCRYKIANPDTGTVELLTNR
jgi:Spy/CpxP family protein refolding chaperone